MPRFSHVARRRHLIAKHLERSSTSAAVAGRWGSRSLVALSVAAIALITPAFSAASPPASSHPVVGAGIANVPTWAKGRRVHFLRSTATGKGAEQSNRHNALCQTGCGVGTPPLTYHGGPVQQEPFVHLIYWGSNWGSYTYAQNEVNAIVGGLNGSAYQGILTQYAGPPQTYTGLTVPSATWIDNSVAAPVNVNNASLAAEVAYAINQTGWTRTPDAQFMVLTPPGTTYASGFDTGFCGYHTYDSYGTVFSFVPYAYGPFTGCENYGPGDDADYALSFVASHEYAESANDPQLNAWYTSDDYEIGDLCAYNGAVLLPSNAYATTLWDNQLDGCASADTTTYAPDETTTAATGITYTGATLNGTVTPHGQDTTYYFQYGPTTAYGSSTSSADAGSGYSPVSEQAGLTGLTPGTTMHYRIVATNANGTTDGQDQTFTVQRTPPFVNQVGTINITYTGATLYADINPDGQDTTYHFEYGPTTAYGSSTSNGDAGSGTNPVYVQANVSGFTPGTTIHFRVVASNASGTTDSSDVSFVADYRVAYNGASGNTLNIYDPTLPSWEADVNTGLTMEAATSPSIAYLTDGSVEVAFQGSNGHLWVCDVSNNCASPTDLGYAMDRGSSPTIAAAPQSGFAVAFEGSNDDVDLYISRTGKFIDSAHAMEPGTSPSMTGGGWLRIAYAAANRDLSSWVWGQLSSSFYQTTQALAPSTSPSLATAPNAQQEIAYQGSNGDLDLYNCACSVGTATDTGNAMSNSPSIAALSTNSFEVAFGGPAADELWLYSTSSGQATDTGPNGDDGPPPTIAAAGDGQFLVADTQGFGSDSLVVYSSSDDQVQNFQSTALAAVSPSLF
jgi:hypothetical protein